MPSNHNSTKVSVLASYCSVSLPFAALGLPLAVYLPPFFAQDLGLGVATVGLIFALARIWDVITDPTIGYLMDRFPSRWGKRRHWIALSVPITIAGAFAIYMPPDSVSPLYLVAWLFVLYLGMTISSVTHQAWGADLTTSYHERSRIYGWREIIMSLGMLLVLIVPAAAEQLWNVSARQKVASMGWFLIISMPIAVLLCLKFVPDKAAVTQVHTRLADIKSIFSTNPAYIRCLLAIFLTFFAASATSGVLLFALKWVWGLEEQSSSLLLLFFLPAIFGAPLWMALSYRLGKPKALLIAMLYGSCCQLGLLFIPHSDIVSIAMLFALMGLGLSSSPILLRSLLADTTDFDALQNKGVYRTGFMFACFTTGEKLAGAMAIGTTYFLLNLIGFDSTAELNSPDAIQGLLYLVVAIPVVANTVAMLILWRFPITPEAHKDIIAELKGIGALDNQ
ncbi:MFS transporter [Spongiibacter sp. KMU-166]|uniref:MFS transporter n=1 Tax=Spongiibacter thalassae TaxID=2721624 RepID=A0ABX1GAE9_9GAMM|nr:MFS transporter [Spongiibacter thalassae]NKI15926.1 MFS transporter [Spongiibacter thalassae]